MAVVEFISVYIGESRLIPLRLQTQDIQSYDLTGATEIQARFRAQNGTALIKTLTNEGNLLTGGVSIVDAAAGRITVNVSSDDTVLMKPGDRQDFTIVVFKGARSTVDAGGVTVKAVEPGDILNGVQLSFNGIITIDQAITAYNGLHTPEKWLYYMGPGTAVPTAGTYALAGGTDSKRVVNIRRALSLVKQSV